MSNVLDKEGFRKMVGTLHGLADTSTWWALDPDTFTADTDRAAVQLELISMRSLGVDEHRRFLSDGTDGYPAGTYWTLEIGNREFVIQVKVEAYDKSVEAAEIVDLMRTLIRSDAATAQLNALKLAYVWSEQTVRLPRLVVNDRDVNYASCDFTFAGIAAQVSSVVKPGVCGDYIATVDGPTNLIPGTLTP